MTVSFVVLSESADMWRFGTTSTLRLTVRQQYLRNQQQKTGNLQAFVADDALVCRSCHDSNIHGFTECARTELELLG